LLEGFGKETESLEIDETSTPPFRALRGEDVLYVEYETGERELYNLRKDPYQLNNIARRTDKSLLRTYSRQLAELSSCAGRTCQAAEDAAPPRAGGRLVARSGGAKQESARRERERSRTARTPKPAHAEPLLTVADAGSSQASIRLSLSRRQARTRQLRLRLHVADVSSPGTLVAAVEFPASGGRERLGGVPVLRPGWVALDIGSALGDSPEIVVGLRGRDGAALMISGPGSSHQPEVVADREQRASGNDQGKQRGKERDKPARKKRASLDESRRERGGSRSRGH
jgi:hypothetical protein